MNNTILAQNMNPETIIAKRIIKDHMISQNVEPHTINIKKGLLLSVKAA